MLTTQHLLQHARCAGSSSVRIKREREERAETTAAKLFDLLSSPSPFHPAIGFCLHFSSNTAILLQPAVEGVLAALKRD